MSERTERKVIRHVAALYRLLNRVLILESHGVAFERDQVTALQRELQRYRNRDAGDRKATPYGN